MPFNQTEDFDKPLERTLNHIHNHKPPQPWPPPNWQEQVTKEWLEFLEANGVEECRRSSKQVWWIRLLKWVAANG